MLWPPAGAGGGGGGGDRAVPLHGAAPVLPFPMAPRRCPGSPAHGSSLAAGARFGCRRRRPRSAPAASLRRRADRPQTFRPAGRSLRRPPAVRQPPPGSGPRRSNWVTKRLTGGRRRGGTGSRWPVAVPPHPPHDEPRGSCRRGGPSAARGPEVRRVASWRVVQPWRSTPSPAPAPPWGMLFVDRALLVFHWPRRVLSARGFTEKKPGINALPFTA